MLAATLAKAEPGLSLARANQLVAGCNQAMIVGAITTKVRCAMFLSQIGTESVSLKYQQEIGSYDYLHGKPYYPYIGRTFIQVTWEYNYAAFGKWCVGKKLLTDPNYFVKNPARLADDRWAWLGAVWFWTTHGLNKLADTGNVSDVTQRINGGQNGYASRLHRYQICQSLGGLILPTTPKPIVNVAKEKPMARIINPTPLDYAPKVKGGEAWPGVFHQFEDGTMVRLYHNTDVDNLKASGVPEVIVRRDTMHNYQAVSAQRTFERTGK